MWSLDESQKNILLVTSLLKTISWWEVVESPFHWIATFKKERQKRQPGSWRESESKMTKSQLKVIFIELRLSFVTFSCKEKVMISFIEVRKPLILKKDDRSNKFKLWVSYPCHFLFLLKRNWFLRLLLLFPQFQCLYIFFAEWKNSAPQITLKMKLSGVL